MKANFEKCDLLLSLKTPKKTYFGGALVDSRSTEKLLGNQIDLTLLLTSVFFLYATKQQKNNKLRRLVNNMSADKRGMVMTAFIESQFNYFPLIWMFHSRTLNNKIKRLHQRTLRIVYSDQKSSFCELLENDKSFSCHKNINKFLHNLSSCIINNIFKVNQTVPCDFQKEKKRSSKQKFQFCKIWYQDHILYCSKNIDTCLKSFKQEIRKWKPDCPCRLYNVCLQHVSFV